MVSDSDTGERAPTVTAQMLARMTGSNGHAVAPADGKRDHELTGGEDAVQDLPTLSELLEGAESFIAQYVVLPSNDASAAQALFVAHTHAFDGAHSTPYLLLMSPERRSGTTRDLEAIELLVSRAWRVIGPSEAALFRKLATKPTLILDEIDAIFGTNTERTEPLRAILNAGNRPGASCARCVGDNQEVVDFPVWAPKLLAGIDTGRLPDTIRDRAVLIVMQRKTAMEHVERFRHRDAEAEAAPIREALAAWADTAVPFLAVARPELPGELNDRAAEAWEPLLAIADMAGGDWPRRARAAAVALVCDDEDESSLGGRLLTSLRDAFGDAQHAAPRTSSRTSIATKNSRSAASGMGRALTLGGWRTYCARTESSRGPYASVTARRRRATGVSSSPTRGAGGYPRTCRHSATTQTRSGSLPPLQPPQCRHQISSRHKRSGMNAGMWRRWRMWRMWRERRPRSRGSGRRGSRDRARPGL
jgi:hypothetical protein